MLTTATTSDAQAAEGLGPDVGHDRHVARGVSRPPQVLTLSCRS